MEPGHAMKLGVFIFVCIAVMTTVAGWAIWWIRRNARATAMAQSVTAADIAQLIGKARHQPRQFWFGVMQREGGGPLLMHVRDATGECVATIHYERGAGTERSIVSAGMRYLEGGAGSLTSSTVTLHRVDNDVARSIAECRASVTVVRFALGADREIALNRLKRDSHRVWPLTEHGRTVARIASLAGALPRGSLAFWFEAPDSGVAMAPHEIAFVFSRAQVG